MVRQTAFSVMYSVCSSLINNSVPPGLIGAINGMAQSQVSLVRAVGPALSTLIFSFSVQHGEFPLDIHSIFILQTCLFIGLLIFAHRLPASLNSPMK